MAKVNKKQIIDDDLTKVILPEEKQAALRQNRLENIAIKQRRFEDFFKEELESGKKNLENLWHGRSFESLPPEVQKIELDRINEEANKRALELIEDPSLKTKSWKEYIAEKPLPPSYQEELNKLGTEGNIIANKFKEAGIDINELTKQEALDAMAAKRYATEEASKPFVPMEELIGKGPEYIETETKNIDLDKIKNQLNRSKKFEKTMSFLKSGAKKLIVPGLTAASVGSDIYEGNIPEAVLDVAEPVIGATSATFGRFVPALELLRSTEPEPKNDVISDIPMKPQRFKKLKKLYNTE